MQILRPDTAPPDFVIVRLRSGAVRVAERFNTLKGIIGTRGEIETNSFSKGRRCGKPRPVSRIVLLDQVFRIRMALEVE